MAQLEPPLAVPQPSAPLQAPFPSPPPFYKHFTKQNVAELRRLRKEAAASSTDTTAHPSSSALDIAALPTELRYLLPPPLPETSIFHAFGASHNLHAPSQTLDDLQIERLYPDHPTVKLNPQQYLISLLRSMLTTYLGLVGTLSQNPELYDGYTKDLRELVANVHDLINQYRPHQARETLIRAMEERVESLREEGRRIAEGKGRVRALLEGLGVQGRVGDVEVEEEMGGGGGNGDEVEGRKGRQRRAWEAIEEVMRGDG